MIGAAPDIAGEGKREYWENQGLLRIFEAFEQDYLSSANQLQNAVVLSPPENWDYGFLFHYEKKYDPYLGEFVVTMHPLRYKEQRNQTEHSKKLMSQISPYSSEIYESTHDFLKKPVFEGTINLADVVQILELRKEDIERAEAFEHLMESTLGQSIAFYAESIIQLHNKKPLLSSKEYLKELSNIETIRRGIFNKAKEAWKNKNESFPQSTSYSPPSTHSIIDQFSLADFTQAHFFELEGYAKSSESTVTGGGSCPVAQKTTGSSTNLISELSHGNSIESIIAKNTVSQTKDTDGNLCTGCKKKVGEFFHCPKCHGDAGGPIGDKGCPHCGLNKQTAKKEGYAVCT